MRDDAVSGDTLGCARVCFDKCKEMTKHDYECSGDNGVSMADIFQVAGAMTVAILHGPNYVHDIQVHKLLSKTPTLALSVPFRGVQKQRLTRANQCIS